MPISLNAGVTAAPQRGLSQTRCEAKGQEGSSTCNAREANSSGRRNALYSYPWLIERISQTFFREWIGAWNVPTKIDHTDWLCTVCQEYTATWETRSGSYCKYCWTMSRVSPLAVPKYMLEMIPLD